MPSARANRKLTFCNANQIVFMRQEHVMMVKPIPYYVKLGDNNPTNSSCSASIAAEGYDNLNGSGAPDVTALLPIAGQPDRVGRYAVAGQGLAHAGICASPSSQRTTWGKSLIGISDSCQ